MLWHVFNVALLLFVERGGMKPVYRVFSFCNTTGDNAIAFAVERMVF